MIKRLKSLPKSVLVMFTAAIVLLAFSAVGGAQAALKYFSETYTGEFQTYHMGISLKENGNEIASKKWASGTWSTSGSAALLGDISTFEFGKTYDENLTVANTGEIPAYVRATVYKYWVDKDGKQTDLEPSYIDVKFNTSSGWVVDTKYSETKDHPERTVLYYTKPLAAGEETPSFMESITADPAVKAVATQTTETKTVDGKEVTTITTTFTYDDKYFALEVQADGVQTHNAKDAIKSAWGRDVTLNGTDLSLN